eukprot:Ihof_evm6s161 gene=Ihof_evmTU6s161
MDSIIGTVYGADAVTANYLLAPAQPAATLQLPGTLCPSGSVGPSDRNMNINMNMSIGLNVNGSGPLPQQIEWNDRNTHVCMECGKIFANQSSLSKHMAVHSDLRPHECPECNKRFKRYDHLSGHMATHRGEKPHACTTPACNKRYSDPRSLKRHMEKQHPEELVASDGKKRTRRESSG